MLDCLMHNPPVSANAQHPIPEKVERGKDNIRGDSYNDGLLGMNLSTSDT